MTSIRTMNGAPREVIVAVSRTGKATVNGPMLKPASQLKPTNSAVATIPATQETVRSVTLIAMSPRTSSRKGDPKDRGDHVGIHGAIIELLHVWLSWL